MTALSNEPDRDAGIPAEPAALRGKLFYPDDDATLFDEAARCFEHGAYRAALVMTWLAVAEGIRHRFGVAAERDAELTALLKEIRDREGKKEAIDSFLLDKARKHGMISAHEKQELAHIRDQRNQFAHPSGKSPTPMQVLAALDAAVRIVLSRPALHRKEWAAALVKQAATERTFFPRDPDGLRGYAHRIDPLLTEEARQHLIHTAFGLLDGLARDPSRADLAENVTILAAAILAGHPELVAALDCGGRLAKRQLGAALVCLRPEVFAKLDSPLAGAALASLLEPPVGAAADWQPDVRALIVVQRLAAECPLPTTWAGRLKDCIAVLPLNELVVLDIPVGPVAERLVQELESGDWYRQNQACRALVTLGPEWCRRLDGGVDTKLASAVLQAAEGDALDAGWLLSTISRTADQWPYSFILFVAAACAINYRKKYQLRAAAQAKVEAILAARGDGEKIIARACDIAAGIPDTSGRASFLVELRQLVAKRPTPLFSAVLTRLTKKTPAAS